MIPVNSGAIGVAGIILLVALLALLGLALLGLLLALPATRTALRRRPWLVATLSLTLLLLALPGAWLLWQVQDSKRQWQTRQSALNPTLEAPLRLGELTFPAGTRVRLERAEPENDWQTGDPLPYGLETLVEAEFVEPQRIGGLRVVRLEAPPRHYVSMLYLAADQPVDGWPCAASAPLEFQRELADRLRPSQWRFDGCELAPEARLGGVVWPAGSQLRRVSTGWLLRHASAREAGIEHAGMRLAWLDLQLDEKGQPQSWQGALAGPLQFGPLRYGPGTEARMLADGVLLFSPRRVPAQHQAQDQPILSGHSVRQATDGRVLGIHANAELGVIDWIEFEVD